MALIVVLSVFNGFESLVVSLFNTFDPPLKVTPAKGKTFDSTAYPWGKISELNGFHNQTGIIEEKALLKYGTNQFLATLKGVDTSYMEWSELDKMMIEGSFVLEHNDQPFAIPGQGIAYYLGINLSDYFANIEVFAPRRTAQSITNPENAFRRLDIRPAGIFSVQQDFDTRYMVVPISFTRELFEYDNELTSVEISIAEHVNMEDFQKQVKLLLGDGFIVKNRFEQQEMLYRVMKVEKYAIFMILSFILLIATFNVIGSLSMLILDKRRDITVLHALGANNRLVQRIFMTEGILVTFSGAIAGMILGALIAVIQQQFGLVKINAEGGSFLISSYPVLLQLSDFIWVFGVVSFIGILAAWIPVNGIKKIKPLPIQGDL